MSAWRRKAAQLLPEQRRCIETASSPLVLWRQLYAFALEICHRDTVDGELLQRLFRYAWDCHRSPAEDVETAVHAGFYERLFDDEVATPHFLPHLRETELLELEPWLARRIPSDDFARIRAAFYRARAELDNGTTLGAARQLKDELVDSGTPEVAELARRAWTIVLPLLEVREDVVGLEILLDSVSDMATPIRGHVESRLRELLEGAKAGALPESH
jgi:hypothetical protein